MLKKSENPGIIWPEDSSVVDFTGRWWVGHTKSRNEKALAWDMVAREINYFLPMNWKVSRSKGRKFKSLVPLFSGYVFFCGDEDDRLKVLQTNRVANIIEVKDQQQFVSELGEIEQALKSGAELKVSKCVRAGEVCQVTAGPLQGLKGVVEKTTTSTRLILNVDMLGQAAAVEIDTDIIEQVN